MNLNELPEQPLTPPEPTSGLQLVCESIRHDTETEQKTVLARRAKEVLRTRMGTVQTVNRDGHYIEFDAADLYDDITANEESADLSILLSACLPDANPGIRRRATNYLDRLIERFADEYAAHAAKKAVEVYLVGLGEAA
jgi:hypothetical protein